MHAPQQLCRGSGLQYFDRRIPWGFEVEESGNAQEWTLPLYVCEWPDLLSDW